MKKPQDGMPKIVTILLTIVVTIGVVGIVNILVSKYWIVFVFCIAILLFIMGLS